MQKKPGIGRETGMDQLQWDGKLVSWLTDDLLHSAITWEL